MQSRGNHQQYMRVWRLKADRRNKQGLQKGQRNEERLIVLLSLYHKIII